MSTTNEISPFLRDALVHLRSSRITGFAARLVGDDAQDVLADVAVSLLERDRADKDPPADVRAFVAVCVKNRAITVLRSRRSVRRVAIEDPTATEESPGLFPATCVRLSDEGGRVVVQHDAISEDPSLDFVLVPELVEAGLRRLNRRGRKSMRDMYWSERPARKRGRRPCGSVTSEAYRVRRQLEVMPEIVEAAERMGIAGAA